MCPVRRCPCIAAALLLSVGLRSVAFGETWRALADDGIHDPKSPACRLLQRPAEALSRLPPNPLGNKVNWVEALQKRAINPREGLAASVAMRRLDGDVVMKNTATMPYVRFPHRIHTQWLDCRGCHEAVFKSTRGANPMTMLEMLRGERCGLCHGAVAFPLSDCTRCHSVAQSAGKQ